jgi:hypothetical protein
MRPNIALLFGFTLALAVSAWPSNPEAGSATGARLKSGAGPPPVAAPPAIWDAWLRFHEAEYCQGLDTVFVFHKNGLEVWCRIEDERSYQRFSELLSPLRATHQIDMYPTRPPAEKKPSDEKNPPPSLWNNDELRTYLRDPFLRGGHLNNPETPPAPITAGADLDFMLKQRIMMFADQTLDWERRMNRYAGDLPALADAAFNSRMPKEIRSRAAAICLAHTQAVDRYAEKLGLNLTQALPRGTKKSSGAAEQEKAAPAASSPRDAAIQVADSAQSVARCIYRFIHPTHYTVGLLDLREPDLLESLKRLRKLISGFQRTLKR